MARRGRRWHPAAAELANKHLCDFFYLSPIALSLIEHPSLKAAFAALGHASLPSRHLLTGPRLDAKVAAVKGHMDSALGLSGGGQAVVGSDMWKRGYCEQGVPLINFELMAPEGGVYFYKVGPLGGRALLGCNLDS